MRARTMVRVGIGAAVATLAAATVVLSPQLVGAGAPVTINVDTTDDEVDDDGDCSLREAVISANTGSSVDDCEPSASSAVTIAVPAGTYVLSIANDTDGDDPMKGDLDITRAGVTLSGAGASSTIIDADGIDRVLDVRRGGDTVIENLTITGGWSPDDGGGIHSSMSEVTVRDSVVTGNRAASVGGGIASLTSGSGLTVERSSVTNNDAGFEGGGIGMAGNGNGLTVVDSTIHGNTAGRGGGINIGQRTAVSIEGSTISANVATGDFERIRRFRGGAIDCGSGGGYNQDQDRSAFRTTMVNTTISGNTSECFGGGVFMTGTGTFSNVTITDNGAPDGGNVAFLPPFDDEVATFSNSIVAQPRLGQDCAAVDGDVVSAGGNIESDDTCGFADASDSVVADVLLGALVDNGGTTRTHLPEPRSAAIDAGLDDLCEADDQRNITRPQDGDGDGETACDIGAVEAEFTPEPTTPTTASDGDVEADTATPATPTVTRPTFTG